MLKWLRLARVIATLHVSSQAAKSVCQWLYSLDCFTEALRTRAKYRHKNRQERAAVLLTSNRGVGFGSAGVVPKSCSLCTRRASLSRLESLRVDLFAGAGPLERASELSLC